MLVLLLKKKTSQYQVNGFILKKNQEYKIF